MIQFILRLFSYSINATSTCRTVNLVAQNQFVDFKCLLPANLTVIAAHPLISIKSLSRFPSSKLAQIQSFRDCCAAWAVYTSVIGKINPARLPVLMEYFFIIS